MNAILAKLHALVPAIPPKLSSGDISEAVLWGILAIYLLLHILVGRYASNKGQSFWFGFFLALFLGPLFGAIFVAFLRPMEYATSSGRRRSR
jgi:hypothetical protein